MAKAQRSYGNGGGDENRGGEKNDGNGVSAFKGRPGSQRKPQRSLFPCQRGATDGHDAPGTPKKVAGHVAYAVNTVHYNYRIAIHLKFQITPKFV